MRQPSDEPSEWRAPGAGIDVRRAGECAVEAIQRLAELPLSALTDEQASQLLDAVTRLRSQVDGVVTAAVAETDRRRLGDHDGHRNTVTWWAHRSRMTRGEAGRLLGLSTALAQDLHAPVRAALATGDLRLDQAGVIVKAVESLPDDVEAPVRTQVRDHLLAEAQHHDALALRRLGKRALEVIDPQLGERHEQMLLEREEARAAAVARFTMVDDGHGQCHGRFTLPTYQGHLLKSHLMALAAPGRGGDAETPERGRPLITPERLGQAFMEYVERYPTEHLPTHGGGSSSLTVTIDIGALATGLGVGILSSGSRISAGEARRLACQAGLLPIVLGGDSLPLDVGRSRRFFTPWQRRAIEVRDRGCTAEGCGMPPQVCHAHHDDQWAELGRTDVARGRLLCPHHHRLAHDRRYEMRLGTGRSVSFHRRT